ncbi:MAG: response regulator [Spirochaetes bacterium]|nr:response regulator [Spirochaetota bacterium]
MKPLSIMVLDDNDDVRDEIVEFLSLSGFSAQGIRCVSDALAVIGKTPPDILILDLRMPDMDGMQVLGKLRSMGSTVDVIMASGYVDQEMEAAAKALGASAVLHKPLAVETLIAAIEATASYKRG